jgi:branched-chain amino acid transport system substrate-binding protein
MGLENKVGAELAVRQLNDAGGVLGSTVELHVEDDGSMPHGAVDAYARLAGQRAIAVIGTSFSNAGLAVLPHTDEHRLLYVSTGAAHTQVDPVRSYVFMTPPPGHLVAEQLLRFLHDIGITEIAVAVDADSVFNRDAWAAQKTMLGRHGIEAAAIVWVNVDTDDFGPAVVRIAESDAQALMAWVTGPPATGLARAVRAAGLCMPMVVGLGAASPGFVKSVGSEAEGIIVATSLVSVGSDVPESATRNAIEGLVGPFERRHGALPSQFAVDGYIAAKLIAAAVEAAGTDDRHAVRDAMERLTCVTAAGRYAFSPTDHSGLDVNDVAVAIIRDGRFRLTPWSAGKLREHLRQTR